MRTRNRWILGAVAILAGSLAVQALPPGAGPRGQEGRAGGARQRAQLGPQEQGGPSSGVRGRPGRQGLRQGIPPVRVLEELGVPEDQIEALQDLQYTQRKAEIDLRANMERADLELRHAMQEGDEAAVMEAVDKVNQARSTLFKQEVSTRLKVREILGEDVLDQLRERRPRERRFGPPREGEDPFAPGPGPDHEPAE